MSRAWQSIGGVMAREWRHLIATPWEWITTIVMPVLWCVMLAALFNGGLMRELPVGIVDLDRTPASLALQSEIDALPSLSLRQSDSPQAALADIRAGKLYGYVVIPEDWTRQANTPQAAAVELFLPKSLYAIGVNLEIDLKNALLAHTQAGFRTLAHTVGANDTLASRFIQTLSVNTVLLGNIGFNFHAYLLATLIPGTLGLMMILAMAGSLTREFRDRTIHDWLASSQHTSWAAVLGKLFFWTAVYSLGSLAYLVYFTGFSGWGIGADLLAWFVALVTFVFVMGALAVLFTSLFIGLGWVIVLSVCIGSTAPVYPYSGFSYPIESMTSGAQLLAQAFPLTHFMKLQSTVWVLQPPLKDWIGSWLLLATFASVALLIGVPLLARRLNRIQGGNHA